MVKFSIIIPSYNSLRTIPATIESLLKDCHKQYIGEITVVDSSDDPAYLEYLTLIEAHKHIKLIRCQSKTMPALARNIGARAAESPYLVFVDSDVIVVPGWSKAISDLFVAGVMAGSGSIGISKQQERNLLALGQFYFQLNEFMDTAPYRKIRFAPSCNMFCTREIFYLAGEFSIIRGSEDVIFGLKVSEQTDIIFSPEAKVYHIFREEFIPSMRNQIMLGKYVNIYRRSLNPSAFYLKGIWLVLCMPAILIAKSLRIVARIARSNNSHRKAFLLSFPFFLANLFFWSYGFVKGGFSDEVY